MKRPRIGRFFRRFAWLMFFLASTELTLATTYDKTVCEPNTYVDETPNRGELLISDFSISYEFSRCPTRRLADRDSIDFRTYDTLHFWMRLQGDDTFLDRPYSRAPLVASFYIRIDSRWVFLRSIGMGRINDRTGVRGEVAANGVFDWRTWVEKWSLSVPGSYILRVEQGALRHCRPGQDRDECGIRFTVR